MLNTESEQFIWESYLNGNNDALSQIHHLYFAQLLSIAYKYTRNKALSEDIIHDLFERLLTINTIDRLRLFSSVKQNPMAFLTVIVRNKCLDEIKIRNNREKILSIIRFNFQSENYNSAYSRFENDMLNAMLLYLEPREAEVLRLHLNGFNDHEISKQLEISYHSAKNNLYEARKKLKKLWKIMTR
jgi:RNA polymerase sigma factor (sigma-70 family)